MIWYNAASWTDVIFRWEGTTIQACCNKLGLFFVYLVSAFLLEEFLDMNFGNAFKHSEIWGKCLCFLIVFRANSSYKRYWEGRMHAVEFYSNLRSLVMLACGLFRGGQGQYLWNRRCGEDGFNLPWKQSLDDEDDYRASHARMDVVRFAIAAAVGLKIHLRMSSSGYYDGELDDYDKWRLNWDRMRLRTLMTEEEFGEVDRAIHVEETHEEMQLLWSTGKTEPQVFHERKAPKHPNGSFLVSMEPSYRQLLVIINFLLMSIKLHANEPYGFKERFLPEFIKMSTMLMRSQDRVNTALCTPLPLPYVNLVRLLLSLYLLSVVFYIQHEDGIWANVFMPTVAALALLGIDQIGTELENPFGDDANDLDVQEMICTFEKEMLRFLELSGDSSARSCFVWLPVPQFMQDECSKPWQWYVAVKSQVEHISIPRSRGVSGVHMHNLNAKTGRA